MSATDHISARIPKKSRRRPRILAALAVVGGVLALAFGVSTAPAAAGDLACTVAGTINFNPPLTTTNTTAKVTESAAVFACNSPNGNYPNLKSGSATGSGTATSAPGLNPCSALITINLTVRVTWNTGQHSVAKFLINTNPSSGPVNATGTVTGGVLKGDDVIYVGPLVPNADCAVNGLSSLTFEGEDIIG